jgi:hypothetical protein
MSNAVLGTPIYSDVGVLYTPTLSGGSWVAGLPLTNLQTRYLDAVARSSNALAASTTFDIDLGVARPLRVFAILVPNATFAATVRFRTSNSAGSFGSPVYDSTADVILPAGQTAETLDGLNVWKVFVASAAGSARYVRVEISDAANPDGYVDVARVVIAGGYQPTHNMAHGLRFWYDTSTTRRETDASSFIYDKRPIRRAAAFTLPKLTDAEAFGTALMHQRLLGTSGQLFFVFDPADTALMHERAFLCTHQELSPAEYAFYNGVDIPVRFLEDL